MDNNVLPNKKLNITYRRRSHRKCKRDCDLRKNSTYLKSVFEFRNYHMIDRFSVNAFGCSPI